jgi:hypothetical protein
MSVRAPPSALPNYKPSWKQIVAVYSVQWPDATNLATLNCRAGAVIRRARRRSACASPHRRPSGREMSTLEERPYGNIIQLPDTRQSALR